MRGGWDLERKTCVAEDVGERFLVKLGRTEGMGWTEGWLETRGPWAGPGMTVMGVPDKEPHKDLHRNHIRTCHRNLHWIDADGGLATFSGGWRGGGTFRG